MPELTILFGLVALSFSSAAGMKIGNPFQVYYFVWTLIFVAYAATDDTWIAVDERFWVLIVASHMIWAGGLIVFRKAMVAVPRTMPFSTRLVRKPMLLSLQGVCACVLPFAYVAALSISGSVSLLEHEGYRGLRHGLSSGEVGFGWTAYLIPLSFFLTSITVVMRARGEVGQLQTAISILVSLGYAFISTGRTYLLLLAVLVIVALVLIGKIGLRGVTIAASALALSFVLSGALTGKGASLDARFLDNLATFAISARSYTVAPFIAFADLLNYSREPMYGQNTFRFFFEVARALGWSGQSVNLVREFHSVPDPTNVYTFFDPYFRDFGYGCILASVGAMFLHVRLYLRAGKGGGLALFFYSASIYPLSMQFFQDQYLSLLSTWIQMMLWMALLAGPRFRLARRVQ